MPTTKASGISLTAVWAEHEIASISSYKAVIKQAIDGGITKLLTLVATQLTTKLQCLKRITKAAFVLRARMFCSESLHLVNQRPTSIVGTGRSRTKGGNISTASSLVVTNSNRIVVKHGGNRVTSRCGATDVTRKLSRSKLTHWSTAAVSAIEVGIGWIGSNLTMSPLRGFCETRGKTPESFCFSLVVTALNPPNASVCVVGCSNRMTARTMQLAGCAFACQGSYVVSNTEGTDKASGSSLVSITKLVANRSSRCCVVAEKLGTRTTRSECYDLRTSEQFLLTLLGILCCFGYLPTLLVAIHAATLTSGQTIEASPTKRVSKALTHLTTGATYQAACRFVRFYSGGRDEVR